MQLGKRESRAAEDISRTCCIFSKSRHGLWRLCGLGVLDLWRLFGDGVSCWRTWREESAAAAAAESEETAAPFV